MRTSDYIAATVSLLNDGKEVDGVMKNLKRVLHDRGHEKLYPRVLRGLQRATERKLQSDLPVVLVAREKDLEKLKSEIEAHLKEFDATKYEPETDTTLIGGYVIEHNHKIIDNSYKSRLVTLYRSLIE